MDILSNSNLKNTFASIKEKVTGFCVKPSKKRLAIIFSLVLILFLVPLHPARADFLTDLITTALLFGPYLLMWIFTGLTVVFVYIATWLVDAALAPGIYMGVINSAAIDRGWVIMRDTANLFFILILIFIAIATTLRLSSYSAKTWIPKLLFAAVFINFSKTITMFIIDIGNMFMYGAISWMGQGIENTGIGSLAATVSGLFWTVSPFQWELITITKMVEVFTAFMFSLILALTLLGFGILLLVRVTMLAILTIFSPIAFMLHAWPNAGAYSGQWWKSLLKYIVFGPIIVFFLFIAGEMATTLFSLGAFAVSPSSTLGDPSNPMSVSLGSFSAFFGTLIPFSIIIIILLSGLSFTSQMGVYGAGLIMGSVKGLAAAGGVAAVWKSAKLSGSAMKGAWSGVKGARSAFQKGQAGGGGIRGGIRALGSATKNAGAGMDKRLWETAKQETYGRVKDTYGLYKNQKDRKDIDAEKKKMEILNKSADDMRKEMDSLTLDPTKKAARLERMAEKGELKTMDKKYLNMATALGTNLNKKLIGDAMPSWVGELKGKKGADADKEVESKVAELVDTGKIRNINPGDWENVYKHVEKELDPQEFDRIINNSSKKTKDNIQKAIKDMIDTEHANFIADPLKGYDKFNYNLADPTEKGLKNFNRKSRLALLQGKGLKTIFDDGSGTAPNAPAVQNFASYNYKDLDRLSEKEDLELIAKHIDENTLSRIRPQDLTPAKAKVIGAYILNSSGKSAGDPIYDYVMKNPVWKP